MSREHLCAESIAMGLDKSRRHGVGKFMACCPAHDDRSPSLAITDADGTTLVYCFAGCSQRDVIGALRAKELWPEERQREANSGPYFSNADLLEMRFYVAVADEQQRARPITNDEKKKVSACNKVLSSKGYAL